ncbi:hypothetical protein DL546_008808 [Coniochaeta pulveracea]|uniref:Uncharacterized protein n=1 Tax=Coniochaeta pulveracea TaxID=177199 RepID=A0A420YGR6_9PEZI|nr:hypothetical protein DL546_008808 [Coniochaeta pulveracea]
MDNLSVQDAVQSYVHAELYEGESFEHWPVALLDETETALAAGACRMFRWAVCQLDHLRRLKPDPKIIQIALTTLPATIEKTYERILSEIPKEQRSLVVRHCLQWIYLHEEVYDGCPIPLSIILQSFSQSDEVHKTLYVDEQVLRKACGCLVSFSVDICFNRYRVIGPGDHDVHQELQYPGSLQGHALSYRFRPRART